MERDHLGLPARPRRPMPRRGPRTRSNREHRVDSPRPHDVSEVGEPVNVRPWTGCPLSTMTPPDLEAEAIGEVAQFVPRCEQSTMLGWNATERGCHLMTRAWWVRLRRVDPPR